MRTVGLISQIQKIVLFSFCLFAFAVFANAQGHAGHEGHKTPSKPKPAAAKPKPKPKPRPAQKTVVKPAEQTTPTVDAEEVDEEIEAPVKSEEAETTEPSQPAVSADAGESKDPEPEPSREVAPTENDQQPKLKVRPDEEGETPAAGEPDHQKMMPEMKMAAGGKGAGRMTEESLMIMSGDQMDIRVGSSRNVSIAMGQMGSGTSWQPATTPMYMLFKPIGRWLTFMHADVKFGVNSQGGPRGVTKFESQNWIMPMAYRRVGPGTLQLRGMFSLEPWTFPRGGSPQLFQTGETFQGRPLIDKQHPHDLFMELSANYTIPVGERGTWYTYVGLPGEPALGPTAFMHRWSASENPSAPLTHHLQDSSHISFGVFTTGFTYRWFKVEGSMFNGREPDEKRYDIEFNPWNSRAIRFAFAPNDNWSAQWSYGLLKEPEALEPGDIRRMTASISHNKRFDRGNLATSFIWGRNRELHDEPRTLNGYTFESTANFLDRNYLYTRLELVDKQGLLSDNEMQRLGITDHHATFRIGAFTFGGARDILNTEQWSVALGSDLTFYAKPSILDSVYGERPVSWRFFVRVRPNKMRMGGASGVHTH